jgi:hypothetical protein
MPNVLDAEPMRAFVRRAGGKIADDKVAARFQRMAFERLLDDPRNFRPAAPAELEAAPDWARQAQARGEDIVVFTLHRGAASRLRGVARRLADACKLAAALEEATRQRDIAAMAAARDFLDKIDRASFEVAARKALYFSRQLASWTEDRDAEPACAAQTCAATQGRVWERITSVGALRAVGREFHNCLARATRSGSYGGMLRCGLAQFWVLRDAAGEGLIVAMAPAPQAAHFGEVRGPRNAPINCEHPDLVRLARFIGIPPADPPPPPTPPDAAALEALRRRASERMLAAAPSVCRNTVALAPSRPRALSAARRSGHAV